MTGDDRTELRTSFRDAVNMSASELERWLETEDSRSVGWTRDGEMESVGHRSGRHIVDIKRRAVADLDDEDYEHMRTVVGYVRRHLAQRPSGDVRKTRWRYSLMNWGHDPLKE